MGATSEHLEIKELEPQKRVLCRLIKDGWLGNCNLLCASPLPGVYCQWCSQVFGVRLWVFTGEGSPNLGFTRQATQIPAQLQLCLDLQTNLNK